MTCREHEAQLVDRARGELEPSAAPSLDQHLGNCPACAARLAREMALTADLRLLAAATAGAGPRDGLEQELLRQFALQAGGEPTPRAGAARGGAYRPAWPAWVAAAASVAILAGAAAWRWAPGRTRPSTRSSWAWRAPSRASWRPRSSTRRASRGRSRGGRRTWTTRRRRSRSVGYRRTRQPHLCGPGAETVRIPGQRAGTGAGV